MADLEQTQLVGGRYAIVREVGRGGSAAVYVATDTKLGGSVAIKALHVELTGSRIADRFVREIKLMADFGHANILPVLDAGEWNGRLFYVMKHVDEFETLRDRLQRHPAGLPLDDVLQIARGICSALSYAHARKVLHRDVKPENILLTGRHAYLTDFGIAKALTPSPENQATTSGYVLGTHGYMSPEQEVGHGPIDNRTDVWSLACVIFESISGVHPFHSPDAARMRSIKLADMPEDLRRHRPSTPLWLQVAVEKGLKSNPADRWQTADEFSSALSQNVSSDSLSAVPNAALGASGEAAILSTPGQSRGSDALALGGQAAPSFGLVTRWRSKVLLGVVVLAATAAVLWRNMATSPPLPDPNVLAVNFTASASQTEVRGLADRVTAEVVRELSRVPAFRVVSPTLMRVCEEQAAAECDRMLTEQRVGTRVEGSLDRDGDSLVIVAQLGDERTRTAMPSITLSALGQTGATSASRLAARLSIAIRQRLGTYGSRASQLVSTSSEEAPSLVRTMLRERADAESLASLPGAVEQRAAIEALRRADSALVRLIAIERRNAPLWIERAWVALAIGQRDQPNRGAAIDHALAYAESAFVRAPSAPGAFEVRGHARLALWQLRKASLVHSVELECDAIADLRRAVAGDEKLHRAWSALSRLLWSAGRTSEARLAVSHAMQNDAFLEGARTSFSNLYYAQLLLENYPAARQICFSGRDLWPFDYKFLECELTLMMYDRASPQDARLARQLVLDMDRLDSREKARAMGNEYRALYRDVVAGVVATRSGDSASGRATLQRVRTQIAATGSMALLYDFRPQEAVLVWELGDVKGAKALLVDWLKNRKDEIANFRQDALWRRMGLRDDVLRQASLPLETSPACQSTGA
ncbi:MAG: protein kinase domain-containing protein [Gemmatimonadaceae bacterium]